MTNVSSTVGQDWFYSTIGTAVGPVTIDEIRRLVASGQLLEHHHVRHAAWLQWSTIAEATHTLGLSPSLPPGQAAPHSVHAVSPFAAPSVPLKASPAGDPSAASFGQRLVSWAIDVVILTGVTVVLNQLPGTASVWATLLAFGAYIAYTVVLPWKGFDTIGHRVTGLSVRDAETGERIGLVPLAARSAVVLLLALPLLIGIVGSAVGASAHPRARAWHDVATGSVVLRAVPR